MGKIYVIDTNVLIQSPYAIERFEGIRFYRPFTSTLYSGGRARCTDIEKTWLFQEGHRISKDSSIYA